VSRWPVRAQLVYLLVVVLVPVFAAVSWNLVNERRYDRQEADAALRATSERVSAALSQFLAGNDALLRRLAQMPLVQAADAGQCDPMLREYVALRSEISNIALVGVAGRLRCAAFPDRLPSKDFASISWWPRVAGSASFMVSEAYQDTVSRRWIVVMSLPVPDGTGKTAGVLLLSADLLSLNGTLLQANPGKLLVEVADGAGRIVLRSRQAEAFIGLQAGRPGHVTASGAGNDRARAARGGSDSALLHTMSDVPGTSWTVEVSMSKDAAFQRADTKLGRAVMGSMLLLLLASVLAWRISIRIVRPIEALAGIAARVALGESQARACADTGPVEVQAVARQVNQMLAALASHERMLDSRERSFRSVFDNNPVPQLLQTMHGTIVDVNTAFVGATGYEKKELLGHMVAEVGLWASQTELRRVSETLRRDGRLNGVEGVGRLRSGEERFVLLYTCSLAIDGVQHFLHTLVDITARRQAQEALREREERLSFLLSRTSAVIYTSRAEGDFGTTFVSESVQGLLGYAPQEFTSDPDFWFSHLHPDDALAFATVKPKLLTDDFLVHEYRFRHRDENYRWIHDETRLYRDANGRPLELIGFWMDVTERKQDAEKIHQLAYFDALTGLPNRRRLVEQLRHSLMLKARNHRHGAVLFIDLDNFKSLNDTQGHDVGDRLLQQVAKRLRSCVREIDAVARLGGDEFVVILDELSGDPAYAATQAEVVGQKILLALNHVYDLGGREHRSTPSIGITLFGDATDNVDDLLKQADLAMYQAKSAGRNTLRFFDVGMQASVDRRVAMEADLRMGLARQELLLHFQPVVRDDGSVVGAEALARWWPPNRSPVPPSEFIPLAEASGLILPLGHWVLQAACAQLAAWSSQPALSRLTLAVNVSAHQFREPDFVIQVLQMLEHSGANPALLKLELTESLLAHSVEDIIAKMTALRAHGIGFSLDDFGTGYSSLAYLKRLPLDQIKIDQSFVRDVLTDPNDAAIARTIIALGESLGLEVIAEGVETEGQREFLDRQGCHVYQGYLFSPPLPIADFDAFVALWQSPIP